MADDGASAVVIWQRSDGSDARAQVSLGTLDGAATTWSPADTISGTGTGSGVNSQQIALSGDGTKAIATWYRGFEREVYDEDRDRDVDREYDVIETAVATISGGVMNWSSTTELSEFVADAEDPQVAISVDGSTAVAIWRMPRNQVQVRTATISGNTASWSSVRTLDTAPVFVSGPTVQISADGQSVTALWYSWNGSTGVAKSASAVIAGGTATWSAVADLSTGGRFTGAMRLSLSEDGTRALAVWSRRDVGTPDVPPIPPYLIEATTASISSGVATWTSPADLSPGAATYSSSPDAVLSADGSAAVATWLDYNGSENIVYSSIGQWSGSSVTWAAAESRSEPGQASGDPSISISAQGAQTTLLWSRSNGAQAVVQSSSASIIGGVAVWYTTEDVSDSSVSSYRPQLGSSANGQVFVGVWYTSDGSNSVIQAAVGARSGVTPPPTPPAPAMPAGPPTDVVGVAGDASASVRWAAPTSTGSFPITNYQVMSAPAGGMCLSTVLSCEVVGLRNGTDYTFTVRALTGAGWGSRSRISNPVTPTPVVEPAMVIVGERTGNGRLVSVAEVSTDMVGADVVAWVKLAGQDEYEAGSFRTVGLDGDFTWQRRTGKKLFVYFESGSVRSNRLIMTAR